MDYLILYGVWATSAALLLFAVPRDKRRVGQAAFLFKQMITWVTGLYVVEKGWLEYPVRFFADVNRASFTFEYFAFPAVCAVFNSRYPSTRSILYQIGYAIAYSTVITIVESILETSKSLHVIQYHQWKWYWTWLSLLITLMLSRLFCMWFFAQKRLLA
ncbi:CBO0543 family protein [Paenibacillus puerhi]|uniref:CBO0543 family protein n=1 Tax=Paenibacillus puerhi TaxID=2692622 RepID=UPI00135835F1|nr:CBO0543 family protein [Paenibacillus puerhi]